jgi:fatty acid desaturase
MNAIPIEERLPSMAELNRLLSSYQKSNTRRSVIQLITSLVPYAALWVLMYFSLIDLLLAHPGTVGPGSRFSGAHLYHVS